MHLCHVFTGSYAHTFIEMERRILRFAGSYAHTFIEMGRRILRLVKILVYANYVPLTFPNQKTLYVNQAF